jgi:predicted enzyme related to lactoylglutathione lyase
MSNPVVHFEIGGRDLPALREFYGKAFGWSISDAGPDYALVEAGGAGIGGGLMKASDQMPAYVTIYVQVEDLRTALAEIGALGGATLVEPTPISDMSSFALFRDPEGNIVGLLEATGPVAG